MAYFSISHNDDPIACAGAADICVLTASVLVGVEGHAQVSAHGMREIGQGKQEHSNWLHQAIRPGDKIDITYLNEGHETTPTNRSVSPALSLDELTADLERTGEELRKLEEQHPAAQAKPSWTKVPRVRIFRVSAHPDSLVNAAIGEEEMLQAVVCFVQGKQCVLEVDAVTVLENGETKGKRWLREELSPGQKIHITYAT